MVEQDKRFMRPAEIKELVGAPDRAGKVLGWEPKVGFEELAQMMVDNGLVLPVLGGAVRGSEGLARPSRAARPRRAMSG